MMPPVPLPARLRSLLSVLVLLLAVGAASPALARPVQADNTADEAEVAFELGNDAYAKGRYQEALRSYFMSYRLVPNRNVLFNIARCFEALERHNEAYRYYLDLAGEPLEAEDAAEVQRSLERLKAKVALVRVESSPRGAEVYVERLDLGSRGRAPVTLALTPGRHRILVRKEGHRPAEATVTLARGRTVTQPFDLVPITGAVELSGSPAGAQVRDGVGGAVVGQVPGRLLLPPGRRLLHVSAPGHAAQQVWVEVPADGTVAQTVTLAEQEGPTGRLVVTATREAAGVRVDGKPAGFTPTVLTLPEGEHLVEVESPDASAVRERVRVQRDREARVHAELRYRPPPVRAASRGLTGVDEAPASVTVLSREELRAFGWKTLAQALAGVRGMFVSDDRMYTTLGVRGFSPPGDLSTRVLILWDGHAVNDVWAGQGYVGHDLAADLEDVERIEVVRGPGSALYGTGAFFAVVNVVPREGLGGGRSVEVGGGVGALGLARAHALAGFEEGEHALLASGSALWAAGAERTRFGAGGPSVDGLDAERAGTLALRGRLGDFTLAGRLTARAKEVPTGAYGTAPGVAGTGVRDTRGWAELRFERALAPAVRLSARGALDVSRYEGRWMYEDAGELVADRDAGGAEWLSGELQLALGPFGDHRLTVGAEAQGQLRVWQEPFGPADGAPAEAESFRRTLLSAYAWDTWTLHPRLSLVGGVRVDTYLDLAVTPVTPRLALLARPYARGLTKLVAGTAFRAPTVYELHYHDGGLTQRAPEGGLLPETIATFELEHAHDLSDELRVTVGGYHNRLGRLVVLEREGGAARCGTAGAPEACLVFANAARPAFAWGAEAGLHWQPGRYLLLDLAYSYVTLVDAADEVARAAPRHLASGRLLVPLADSAVRLATQAVYQGPRVGAREPGGPEAGEALLVSLGLSGEVDRFRYFAGVQNLLDAQYALPLGEERGVGPVPQYGRTFLLELSASF